MSSCNINSSQFITIWLKCLKFVYLIKKKVDTPAKREEQVAIDRRVLIEQHKPSYAIKPGQCLNEYYDVVCHYQYQVNLDRQIHGAAWGNEEDEFCQMFYRGLAHCIDHMPRGITQLYTKGEIYIFCTQHRKVSTLYIRDASQEQEEEEEF